MRWGKAVLAAWACTQLACGTGTLQEREHRFPCHPIQEHGSAQAGLWCVVMSFVRAAQAGADTGLECLNLVNGTGRGEQCSPFLAS